MIDRRLLIPEETPGHGYRLNGVPLVAVTTVIGTVLRAPQLEEWLKRMGLQADTIRDEAAAFGKSIDAGVTAHALGQKIILDMPDAWEATVEAGRRWLDDNLEEIFAVQEPIASAKYGYAGRPDLYGRRIGHKTPCLVDYKATGGIYWSHLMQLAAYRKAAVETYGDKPAERIVLHFSKDEPGKVTPHIFRQHDRDFALFGYALGMFQIIKGGI